MRTDGTLRKREIHPVHDKPADIGDYADGGFGRRAGGGILFRYGYFDFFAGLKPLDERGIGRAVIRIVKDKFIILHRAAGGVFAHGDDFSDKRSADGNIGIIQLSAKNFGSGEYRIALCAAGFIVIIEIIEPIAAVARAAALVVIPDKVGIAAPADGNGGGKAGIDYLHASVRAEGDDGAGKRHMSRFDLAVGNIDPGEKPIRVAHAEKRAVDNARDGIIVAAAGSARCHFVLLFGVGGGAG